MPQGAARYGPIILGFTNANPGVITVDNAYQVFSNERIRVASIADDQSGSSLNGEYTIDSATTTQITLKESTLGKSAYISGGFVTSVELDNPTEPNPPYDINNRVPSWWNQSSQI